MQPCNEQACPVEGKLLCLKGHSSQKRSNCQLVQLEEKGTQRNFEVILKTDTENTVF